MVEKLFCPVCKEEIVSGDQMHRKVSGIYSAGVGFYSGWHSDHYGSGTTKTELSFRLAPPKGDGVLYVIAQVVMILWVVPSAIVLFIGTLMPSGKLEGSLTDIVQAFVAASICPGMILLFLLAALFVLEKERNMSRARQWVKENYWEKAYYCAIHDHVWDKTLQLNCPAVEFQKCMENLAKVRYKK